MIDCKALMVIQNYEQIHQFYLCRMAQIHSIPHTSIGRIQRPDNLPQENPSNLVALAFVGDLGNVSFGMHYACAFQFFLQGVLKIQGDGVAKLGT